VAVQEAKINLEINQKGDAKAALKETAAAAKSLADTQSSSMKEMMEAEEKYQNALEKRIKAMKEAARLSKDTAGLKEKLNPSSGGGLPGGLGGLGGGAAGLSGLAGAGMAAIQLTDAALGGLAKGINLIGDSSKTAYQKSKEFASNIPIVGALFQLGEALDGKADRIRKATVYAEQYAAGIAASGAAQSKYSANMSKRFASYERAQALGSLQLGGQGSTARGTYSEQLQYNDDQKRLQSKDKLNTAQAIANAARAAEIRQQEQLSKLDQRRNAVLGEREEAEERLEKYTRIEQRGYSSGGRRNEAANEVANLDKRLASLRNQREESASRLQGMSAERAQAESQARQANIELLRTELGLLQQKEQRLSSQAQAFGRLNEVEKDEFARVAELASTQGIKALLPQERDLLERGGAGGFVGKELEAAGANDPRLAKVQGLGVFEKGNLGDVRNQVDTQQQSVRVAVQFDQAQLAKDLNASLATFSAELLKTLRTAFTTAANAIKTQQTIRNSGG